MPRMDSTGPMGQGPMTGQGLGRCGGGFSQSGRGGRCCGFGMGRRFYSPKNELSALEQEEQSLKADLATVQEEINALKSQK